MKIQENKARGRITSNFGSIRDCRIFTDAPSRAKIVRGDVSEAYGRDLPSPTEARLRMETAMLRATLERPAFLLKRIATLQAEIAAMRVNGY